MKTHIINALTKNIGLKLLALVFSFLLWLVVVNIDDPTQTRTFTAVVSVTNESVLEDAGKLYEIRDGVNTVSFRVTAKRSIIEKLSPSDFSAIADMNYLESEERIPVTITAKTYSNYITISSKQNYLYVVLEDKTTNKFVINAQTTGTLESELAINSVSCSPTVITVSGPDTVVSSIANCVAEIDITGVTNDITENVIPKFYDASGELVDTSKLTLSISSVSVSVDFASLKTVDIAVKTSGTLPEHLTLGSIYTDPASVMLRGESAALNDVTAVTIPDTVINLSDVNGSFSTTVDISSYLPEGVSLADSASSKVTIYVVMEGEEAKTLTASTEYVDFRNLADGLTATIDVSEVTTNIYGTASKIANIDGSYLVGFIDCSNLTAGEHSVILQFNNLEDVTIQNVTVNITITSEESGETDNSTDTNETTDSTEEKTEE